VWGKTKHFCPVSFAEESALVPGKEEFAASFGGYLYCFAGKEELHRFLCNAPYYLDKIQTSNYQLPPPKVFVFGTSAARKVSTFTVVHVAHTL
jgi:hypothetical protein